MSKIYGQIVAFFAYQGLYKESWDAARLEYAYADTAQNFQGMAFALRNMARIYHVFGKPDSAALAYRKGYDLAIQNHANHTAYSILSELGGLYYEEKQFDSAYSILRQVLSHYSFPNANMLMGGVYYELGKPDSAEHYIRQVFKYGTLHNKTKAYEIFAKISAYRQDYIQAYQYMRKYVAYQDSIDFIIKTQEVAKVNALYDYRTTQKRKPAVKRKDNPATQPNNRTAVAIRVFDGSRNNFLSADEEKAENRMGTNPTIDVASRKPLLPSPENLASPRTKDQNADRTTPFRHVEKR